MQDIVADLVKVLGDPLASFGFIAIGLFFRRLWFIVLLALLWAVITYAINLANTLGVSVLDIADEADWVAVRNEAPLRLGVAAGLSLLVWFCMGLVRGGFRTRRRVTAVRAAGPHADGEDARAARLRAVTRRGRREPELSARGGDEGDVASPQQPAMPELPIAAAPSAAADGPKLGAKALATPDAAPAGEPTWGAPRTPAPDDAISREPTWGVAPSPTTAANVAELFVSTDEPEATGGVDNAPHGAAAAPPLEDDVIVVARDPTLAGAQLREALSAEERTRLITALLDAHDRG